MHIVQLIPELNEGGVERGVLEFNREFVRRGHRSTVLSAGGRLASQINREGGCHVSFECASKNPLTLPFRIHRLGKILDPLKPDILHARSRVPAWLAWFALRRLKSRPPFITTVHGFNSVNAYSRIMTMGDHVICVSHPISGYIRQHYGVPEERITVIHRGVDPEEWDPDQVDSDWINSFKNKFDLHDKSIVTSVGRITELKDFETLIHAMAVGSKTLPNLKALIVGGVRDDKLRYFEKLKSLASAMNLQDRVVFAGSQSHMREIYHLSHLVVSCSKKPESFGRTLVEAMAMNTPVMATRHGGALDIVKDPSCGILFPVGDHQALFRGMLDILQHPRPRTREYVLSHFTLSRMIDKTIGVYRRFVADD